MNHFARFCQVDLYKNVANLQRIFFKDVTCIKRLNLFASLIQFILVGIVFDSIFLVKTKGVQI